MRLDSSLTMHRYTVRHTSECRLGEENGNGALAHPAAATTAAASLSYLIVSYVSPNSFICIAQLFHMYRPIVSNVSPNCFTAVPRQVSAQILGVERSELEKGGRGLSEFEGWRGNADICETVERDIRNN